MQERFPTQRKENRDVHFKFTKNVEKRDSLTPRLQLIGELKGMNFPQLH
jgi:hypothetical protein